MMMRIAVAYENGMVFQHFGHTQQFKVYEVEDGVVLREEIVDAAGSGHGALAGFLGGLGAEAVICGGIGAGAQAALAQAGIRLYGGVSGSADEAVRALATGTLRYRPEVSCSHYGQDGQGCHREGHGCGEDHHGCHGHS